MAARTGLILAAYAANAANKSGGELAKKLPKPDDDVQGKTSVMSTFSPFQASLLGTGRSDDFLHQIASNTHATNESVKKIKTAGMRP